MPLNTIILVIEGENMIIHVGKYLSFHCSVRYLMRGIHVAETCKFLWIMFPRVEEEEERRVHKSMMSEISVKVSNVSLYVRVTKLSIYDLRFSEKWLSRILSSGT